MVRESCKGYYEIVRNKRGSFFRLDGFDGYGQPYKACKSGKKFTYGGATFDKPSDAREYGAAWRPRWKTLIIKDRNGYSVWVSD